MKKIILRDVTMDNLIDVIRLKSEDKEFALFEKWVASNVFSLAQAKVQPDWVTKAIYDGTQLIGFTMFGLENERNRFELCRIMIDYKYQGKGYGTAAVKEIISEMIQTLPYCDEIYLSVIPSNLAAIHVYTKAGFTKTGEIIKGFVDEDVYCFKV
ncbi:GNAT family N-acetyltransferase [Bacillus timonensis]|uniref:GNAT family N-acetyltransferase n=1 Tax=Bacillus timonensis TaxID=1033734 RepID=A0A4S3PU73_9BACI|nr:GNAT family N-acetyltransferase [Bacillus timonensis]THE13330.1 GNAT family N-acetyltransferase [Bacillus timonensis]